MIYMDKCIAVVDSMTYATKAQRILAGAAIYAEVIKVDQMSTVKGCAYGLRYQCVQENNVKEILTSNRIRVKKYISAEAD